MINFIKGIVPNTFLFLGYVCERLSKGIAGLGTIITHVGIQLHINFGTKLGKQFKDMQDKVKAAVQQMMNIAQQLQNQPRDESAKLANIVKGKEQVPVKLVKLGKKEDGESNS